MIGQTKHPAAPPAKKRWICLMIFILALVLPFSAMAEDSGEKRLIPGGDAFGVRMYTKGVRIVGFSEVLNENGDRCCPAKESGLRIGDVIVSVGGKEAIGTQAVVCAIEECKDAVLKLNIKRGDQAITADLRPVRSSADGIRRAGFWIRDNTAGIGTVTFIDPESNAFGGLGHGICDPESGAVIPFESGTVYDVSISGIGKGRPGAPGELKGFLLPSKTGALISNTPSGVYGILASLPEEVGRAIAVAKPDELRVGKAFIRCTLGDDGATEYEIRIDRIRMENGELKNFEITVTDPALIARTGGIVQGMSGSPILQDGKIVGAVTHVLINDPVRGYGIYIGNMLKQLEESAK